MNIRYAIILAIWIVLTSACHTVNVLPEPTLISTKSAVPGTFHFENELVAFDYPGETRIYSVNDPAFDTYPNEIRLGGELVVGLADPSWIKSDTLFSSIGVFYLSQPPGSNLEEVMQAAYEGVPLQNEAADGNSPITIYGLAR